MPSLEVAGDVEGSIREFLHGLAYLALVLLRGGSDIYPGVHNGRRSACVLQPVVGILQ